MKLIEIIKKDIQIILISFLLGLVISSLYFFMFTKDKKTFVFVNIENIIGEISTNLAAKKLNDKELKFRIEESKQIFRDEVESYASFNNAVVMSSEKVIAGARDITEEIKAKTIKRLE